MKRANHLIPLIADPDNLRLAFWKARKGKNHAAQVEAYRNRLDKNLTALREQITTGLLDVGKYHYFRVYEPKERLICAAAFDEQVLHHTLMNVCHEHFERHQIFDSYASRKGKGNHAALARARSFTKQYDWYLKLDVRKFFETIHHGMLKAQLEHLFKERRLLEIFGKIIDSYEAQPQRGVPIGNLSSQYFANHYLSGLDHFIKEKLGVKAYVRYMDDMVLWSKDKAALKRALVEITTYIEGTLHCTLKPVQLQRCRLGLPFLGYRLLPYQTRLLQQSKQRFIRKLNIAEEYLETGEWSQATYQRHVLPLLAFTWHADTEAFRRKVIFQNIGQLP
ncbi:MAG: hypothetical protein KF852_11815 [Saprospiraceae bacterium]|nr:hypothetical protein [Saprospiraceae bacterium]